MSGASIAPLFNIGPQITGAVLGLPYAQYRANGPLLPTDPAKQISTINCWITADETSYGKRPFVAAKPIAYGLFDPTVTQVGDYLIGPLGTFYVASQDVPMPIQVVRCNQTITVSRPGSPVPGADYYGAAMSATLTPLLTSWPAALIQGTKGETGEVKLPGDTRLAWAAIMLPSTGGVEILPGDWVSTAQSTAMIYTVSSCEITALGWRLSAATGVA